MTPAARRWIAISALSLLASAESFGAQAGTATVPAAAEAASPPVPARAAPTRPFVPPPLSSTLRLGNTDYASATDLAVWLGLKGAWLEPQRRLALVDKNNPNNKAELNADSRDASVNGQRVFLGMPTVFRDGKLFVSRIDAERCLAPLLRPGFNAAPLPTPRLIVLDPGHGGEDPGTENRALGLKEKALTLDVAERTKKLLEAAGFKVLLTRSGDTSISPSKTLDLSLRPNFANRQHADLFVSIHFNAAAKDTRGTEVFTYAPRGQHATDWWGLISREDSALETSEQPVNRFDHWSVVLAGALHRRILQTLKTEDRGEKIAHWAVLKTLNCPGVLVEPAIISNDIEARRVATPAFRQQIAEGIAAGVLNYADTLDALQPKPQAPSVVSQTK